jgi:hypothetical protein
MVPGIVVLPGRIVVLRRIVVLADGGKIGEVKGFGEVPAHPVLADF